jgi:hypothetical protein
VERADELCVSARKAIRGYVASVQREVRAEARIGQSSGGLDFLRVLLERWKSWEMATVSCSASIVHVLTGRVESAGIGHPHSRSYLRGGICSIYPGQGRGISDVSPVYSD